MTWEEILAAMKATPQLAVQVLENVPNIPGGAQYLANANKAYFDENVGAEVSKIYNGIDEDIFTLTGKRKKADQKTYDFVKEVVGEFKKLAEDGSKNTPEETKKMKDKIAELEEKVKNGESSTHWKQSYEEVVAELKTQKEKHEQELNTLNTKMLQTTVETDITTGVSGLKFNEQLPETVINAMINQAKGSLVNTAKIIDGKVVYHDAEGKPLRNKQHEYASANDLLKETLKDILAGDKQPGGGAPPTGKGEVVIVGTGDSAKQKLVIDKSAFSTKVKFQEVAEKAMLDKGLTRGSKEWKDVMDEAYKEYGVSELERV